MPSLRKDPVGRNGEQNQRFLWARGNLQFALLHLRRLEMKKAALGAVVTLTLSAIGTGADEVHLANGDRLSGTVVGAPAGQVAIDMPGIGVVTVPEELVASVKREHIPQHGAEGGTSAVKPEQISQPGAEWETSADLGVLLSTGNSRARDATVVLSGKRGEGRFEQLFGVSLARSEGSGSADSACDTWCPRVRTRDQLDIDYEARWRIEPAWYLLGNFELFRDPIKEIDGRITLGAGAGRTLRESDAGSLTTDIGISQVRESLIGGNQNNPALRWGVTFNHWLQPERFELFHHNQLLKILDAARGAVWDSGSGIRFHLSDTWQASLRLDLQHETQPAPGRERTDATYSATLGIKF